MQVTLNIEGELKQTVDGVIASLTDEQKMEIARLAIREHVLAMLGRDQTVVKAELIALVRAGHAAITIEGRGWGSNRHDTSSATDATIEDSVEYRKLVGALAPTLSEAINRETRSVINQVMTDVYTAAFISDRRMQEIKEKALEAFKANAEGIAIEVMLRTFTDAMKTAEFNRNQAASYAANSVAMLKSELSAKGIVNP